MGKPTCCQDSEMNRMRARAERAERELGEYQAKACEDLAAAWRERDEARDKLADCESYHRECGDCGKTQTFIGKGLFECYSCAWREASEEVRALQAKLAEAETFRREWGEAHNRLTTLTDELLGPAPTMPLLALIERLERADPRARLAKTEAVARKVAALRLGPLGHCSEHMAMLVAEARRALDEDSGGSGAAMPVAAREGSSPDQPGPCGLMHVRCANCTDYIDRENAHDCTRGKNACGECDQEPCACPDPQAPATRAELEELRRRIDRLESLTDNEE